MRANEQGLHWQHLPLVQLHNVPPHDTIPFCLTQEDPLA